MNFLTWLMSGKIIDIINSIKTPLIGLIAFFFGKNAGKKEQIAKDNEKIIEILERENDAKNNSVRDTYDLSERLRDPNKHI